ncbi:MAG: hypothetical protein V1752_06925 [Candidatus Firestonebacteria bacterium]
MKQDILIYIMITLLGLFIAYEIFRYVKMKPPRTRRKILMIFTVIFLSIFLTHTVLVFITMKNYEFGLKKIKELGLPVNLEEIVLSGKNKNLSPEDNIAEHMKKYDDFWPEGTSWKGITSKGRIAANPLISEEESIEVGRFWGWNINAKNYEILKNYLKKNAKIIEVFYELTGCKGYYLEKDQKNPIASISPELLFIRDMFEIMDIKIAVECYEKNTDKAVSDLEKYFYLNEILNLRNDGNLLDSMVGSGLVVLPFKFIENIALDGKLDQKQCELMLNILEKNEKNIRESFTSALNVERASTQVIADPKNYDLILMQPEAFGRIGGVIRFILKLDFSYLFRPINYMERKFLNDIFTQLIVNSKKETFNKVNDIVGLSNTKAPWYFLRRDFVFVNMENIDKQVFLNVNEVRRMAIIIMLEQYKQSYGSYPQSLSELSKKTGRAFPVDSMTGKEFVYSLKGDKYVLSVKEEDVDTNTFTVSVTNTSRVVNTKKIKIH